MKKILTMITSITLIIHLAGCGTGGQVSGSPSSSASMSSSSAASAVQAVNDEGHTQEVPHESVAHEDETSVPASAASSAASLAGSIAAPLDGSNDDSQNGSHEDPLDDSSDGSRTQSSAYEKTEDMHFSGDEDTDVINTLQGLWCTCGSIANLYSFEGDTVVFYENAHPEEGGPLSEQVYIRHEPAAYSIQKLEPDEGAGSKVIMGTGSEYWMLDGTPDVLECHWYDESGELQYSGSDSLGRITDLTADDIVVEGENADEENREIEEEILERDGGSFGKGEEIRVISAEADSYADVVRDYQAVYGELKTLSYDDGIVYYSGVFLVDLIDCDRDGSEELVIGYSQQHDDEHICLPQIDVWGLDKGTPKQLYEGAYVQHGDIGRHCGYTSVDGQFYLLTGNSGYSSDLKYLQLKGGHFVEGIRLERSGFGDEWKYRYNGSDVDETELNNAMEKLNENADIYSGGFLESSEKTESGIRADLERGLKKVGID